MIKQRESLSLAEKIILILLFIGSGFFYFEKVWASQNILISEIYGGGGNSGSYWKNDFIEIYNPNNFSIPLDGWSVQYASATGDFKGITKLNKNIPAKSYYLIQGQAEGGGEMNIPMPDATGDISMSATAGKVALVNNANPIISKADENVIDFIGYGSANEFEGQATSSPGGNVKSLARKIVNGIMQDTDNNNIDFEIKNPPEPQNSSLIAVSPLPPADQPTNTQDPAPATSPLPSPSQGEGATTSPQSLVKYKLGDVVINEFVSDPADEEVEWIELYNTMSVEINLTGWTIEEGSGAKTSLTGIIAANGNGKFTVIEKPKGNLNNGGDIIILRDGKNNLIDQVAYGNWNDGNADNNAPAANDPNSVARKFDGHNSFNNAEDFAVTAAPTKGKSNIIKNIAEDSEENNRDEKNNYDYSDKIIISEIFPNPVGSDNENEFIELYNKGNRDVDLTGWMIGDDSKKKYEIANSAKSQPRVLGTTIIKTKGYLTIYRSESKIALNNNGDSVKLYQPLKDEPSQTVKYEKAAEGWSYNFDYAKQDANPSSGGKYVWSEVVTPGKENIIKTINHKPTADFDCPQEITAGVPVIFDSSDTIDEDGDELKYFWDFGDGITNKLASPEHTFLKQGAYTVKLTVNDGENEAVKEKIIKAAENKPHPNPLLIKEREIAARHGNGGAEIIINEFLPNTEGADAEEEWIELKNAGGAKINLLNWKLDDSEGGSKPYAFKNDLWLNAGKFFTVERVESGLALNNNADAIRLFNDLDELMDEVEYEATVKGASYARGQNNKWFWTNILTPGEENIISVSGLETVDYETAGGKTGDKIKKVGQIIETTLEKIKEFEAGDLIKVKGTVAVEPGILGSQYFYIVGSPGIQIYNYKKEFPGLRVGDYVEVSGELSAGAGEPRLKTKQADDIKILAHREPPAANELTCEKINDDYVGQLARVTGEVTGRKSSIVYLDDGTDEIIVYIKKATGINPASIKEGEKIAVTGLVGRTSSGVRIMPRSSDDIVKKDVESAEAAGQVLGEIMAGDEWEVAKRDKKLELFKYLLLVAGGAIMALAGLLIKIRRKLV
ncbi:MAG: lamin tail domain-containing protein [bacterium]|nr:lamin tail domain-containing protein [bacterium]